MKLTTPLQKYGGKMATKIRNHVEKHVLPLAAHTWYWQRAMRWITEFGEFAERLLKDELNSGIQTDADTRGIRQLLGDSELLDIFIASLTVKGVGFSVPRAARRFLSAARMRLGFSSLNDIKTITEVIKGHERSTPRTVIQAESLELSDVERIAAAYGCSKCWWELQVALMIALCFVAILRLGELIVLLIEDIMLVFDNGRERQASKLKTIPRRARLKGAFFHIRWRKAGQSHSVQIPVSCPRVLSLLLRHLRLLWAKGRTEGPLFPSRMSRVRPQRHATNSVSARSARDALRKALREVCGLTKDQAKLFSGHSMRVGGSNHMRRLGVAHEVHKYMGGWASLEMSQRYYQLTTKEQFEMTHKWALMDRVPPRVEGDRVGTLTDVQSVALG